MLNLFHRKASIMLEAVIESVSEDGKTFSAILANARNGRSPLHIVIRLRPGQTARPGQLIHVTARLLSFKLTPP